MKISKGIGIDLGTTNSAVAIMDLTDTDILMYTDKQGVNTTPSVVWHDRKKGEIVVGKRAFQQRGSNSEPIVSIKRWMGTDRKVKVGDQEMTPEQVSAEILKVLRAQIEGQLKEMSTPDQEFIVDRAIITIPAYFQLPAIEATRKAGELAGLDIIELLHEPTAAAVHYAWEHNLVDDCTFMVFDPGGGTFDVSILRRTAGEPEVLGISGDTFLGGDDLDRCLAEHIRQRLMNDPDNEYDLDFDTEHSEEDKLTFAQFVLMAEGVKKRLSGQGEELLRDTRLYDKNGIQIFIEMMIERGEFEEAISGLVDRMIPKCWEALAKAYKKAQITLKNIDYILLVGGTSYVPLVQQRAKEIFCNYPGARPLTEKEKDWIAEQVVDEHRETVRFMMGLNERARCSDPVFEKPDTCNARGAAIRAALDGLAVYNDDMTIRVIFRGQGATANSQATLAGRVDIARLDGEGRHTWQSLQGGSVKVELTETDFEDQDFLDATGNFRFKNLPLQLGTVNQYRVQVYDEANRLLATVGRVIAQDDATVDLGSGVLTTAVLPTPIRIEGIVNGRIGRRDLIPEGTYLSATAQFTFHLEDNPGYIVIPLFQGNRLIKEIHQDIDMTLPPGTPIDFNISIDKKAFIVCRGRIGIDEFNVAVEPPSLKMPTPEEIQQLLDEFEEALAYRTIGDAAVLRRKIRNIKQELEEARQRGEEPRVIERFEAMMMLLQEATNVIARLEPPKEEFDNMVRICLQLSSQLSRINPAHNVDETEKNIRTQQQAGEAAAEVSDQQAYGDAFRMLVQYAQALQQEIEKSTETSGDGGRRRPDQPHPPDPAQAASGEIDHLRGVCAQLRSYAVTRTSELQQEARSKPDQADKLMRQAKTATDMETKLIDIERALAQLKAKVGVDPDSAMRECQSLKMDITRIYDILENLGAGGITGRVRI